jgi:hypothetical protein
MFSKGKQPKIVFSEESWDFGKIKEGEVVSHVFKFENKGESELVIQKVEASCGCTAVLISKNRLSPGEKGEIKATFNSKGFQGKVTKLIFVYSNDPVNSLKQLKIAAEVLVPPRPKIKLIPNYVDIGIFLDDEEVVWTEKIKNEGEKELIINRIASYNEKVKFFYNGKKINFPFKIKAGEIKEIKIKLSPKHKRGVMREYIQFNSNDSLRPTITLYLTGYVINRQELQKLFSKYKNIFK